MNDRIDLDLIGGIMGTDKSSATHNYLVHYDRLFSELRSSAFNFIEIGIFQGASLATWREYFERATVIGVDIQEACRQYAKDGVIVEIGSQDDPEFLLGLVRRYPPLVIMDDGSHMAHHVLFAFETLFPTLEPGGIYVVEDMHFHAGANRDFHSGPAGVNPIDYFLALSRGLVASELEEHKRWGFQAYAARTIDEIVFFGRAVAIRKKPAVAKADNAQRASALTSMAQRVGTVAAWDRAARFLQGNGDPAGAITALQRAIEINPKAAEMHRRLSELLSARGEREAALRHAELSVEHATHPVDRGLSLECLGDIFVNRRRFAEAVVAFREAAGLIDHPVLHKRIEDKAARWAKEA